jgi:uncharacterized OB-fold protein
MTSSVDGRPALLGGHCKLCGTRMFPKTTICPACAGETIEDVALPQEGVLYSFTDVYVGLKGLVAPAAIGYVDLTDGVRIFTHLERDGHDLIIGQTVVLKALDQPRGNAEHSYAPFVFVPTAAIHEGIA